MRLMLTVAAPNLAYKHTAGLGDFRLTSQFYIDNNKFTSESKDVLEIY